MDTIAKRAEGTGLGMKEYEYISLTVDELFSPLVTSCICLENLGDKDAGKNFRFMFTLFNKLRQEYQNEFSDETIPEETQAERCKALCKIRKEGIFSDYLARLKQVDSSIDYEKAIQKYREEVSKMDVESLELDLMIYPYLISLIRKEEETKGRSLL